MIKKVKWCPRCGMAPMLRTYDGQGCLVCGHNTYENAQDGRGSVTYDPSAHTSLVRGLQIATRRK